MIGPLPAGEVAEYQFTLNGNTGALIVAETGYVTLQGSSGNLFLSLSPIESAVFGFDYTNTDTAGLVSNTAHVDLTITGINDAPVAEDNSYIIPESTTDPLYGFLTYITDFEPYRFGNILNDPNIANLTDYDPDGTGSFHLYSIQNMTLTINGDTMTLLSSNIQPNYSTYTFETNPITTTDVNYFFDFLDNQSPFRSASNIPSTAMLTIYSNGEITLEATKSYEVAGPTENPLLQGAQNSFINLALGEDAQFTFQYITQDNEGLLSNVAQTSLIITGDNDAPVINSESYQFYESDITNTQPNIIAGNIFSNDLYADPDHGDSISIQSISNIIAN